MRQRNTSGHVQNVMAWPTEADPERRPFTKGPGEEVEFPELLAGFTPLDEPATEADGAQQDAAEEPAAKTKPTRKSSAAPAAEGSD